MFRKFDLTQQAKADKLKMLMATVQNSLINVFAPFLIIHLTISLCPLLYLHSSLFCFVFLFLFFWMTNTMATTTTAISDDDDEQRKLI